MVGRIEVCPVQVVTLQEGQYILQQNGIRVLQEGPHNMQLPQQQNGRWWLVL